VLHLREIPRNATQLPLNCQDPALEPAVSEGVLPVEGQVPFVREVAVPGGGIDVTDVGGADHGGGKMEEVFVTWLHLETPWVAR
jgi:hypothetical protein